MVQRWQVGGRWLAWGVLVAAVLGGAAGRAQELTPEEQETLSPAAQRFRELARPDAAKKEAEKADRPPFEFYRSQVAPNDVVPYVKANHWVTATIDTRANLGGYEGSLRTTPVRLEDMPHEVIFGREVILLKEQTAALGFQAFIPPMAQERGELPVWLKRPDSLGVDGSTIVPVQFLRPHQMLIPVLGLNAGYYASWNWLQAAIPASGDRDQRSVDADRYYRFIIPQNPEKPLRLSGLALCWTAISHLIWDDLDPQLLDLGQQQALLDWMHWGGQLVVVAPTPNALAILRESFLGPYMPARATGESLAVSGEALTEYFSGFARPVWSQGPGAVGRPEWYGVSPEQEIGTGKIALMVNGLEPEPSAVVYRAGKSEDAAVLAVERRVGRGRLMVLGFNPHDRAIVGSGGYDDFVRRIILRRPAEPWQGADFAMLSGQRTSWLRLLGRDLGAVTPEEAERGEEVAIERHPPRDPVAAWTDDTALVSLSRRALEGATGITVPDRRFVLRLIGIYILCLVPLNWLVARFLFGRPELAWVFTPLLALGISLVIERAASYHVGYDLACDEIDLLELQAGYPRGYLTRFTSVYSSGRQSLTVSFPDDPAALALPMNLGSDRYRRGEDILRSSWESYPGPALRDFPVPPRSMTLCRAEQMIELPGDLSLVPGEDGTLRLINRTGLDLRGARLIEEEYPESSTPLGSIGQGQSVVVKRDLSSPAVLNGFWTDPEVFLDMLEQYSFEGPEDAGELRLVAWAETPYPGMSLSPLMDRHRGLTLVVAHLKYGPPPDPDQEPYLSAVKPGL